MALTTRIKVLIGIAVAVLAYVVLGQKDDSTTMETVGPSGAARLATSSAATAVRSLHRQTPRPASGHLLELLAHRVADSNGSGALFPVHSWYVAPPPPPPPAPAPAVSVAPPAPVAPPLPFKYIGTYTPAGEAPVFLLTQGDRVYDVRVGETLASLYSIDGFDGAQLLLTYKPLEIQQPLAVTANQTTIAAGGSQ